MMTQAYLLRVHYDFRPLLDPAIPQFHLMSQSLYLPGYSVLHSLESKSD